MMEGAKPLYAADESETDESVELPAPVFLV